MVKFGSLKGKRVERIKFKEWVWVWGIGGGGMVMLTLVDWYARTR